MTTAELIELYQVVFAAGDEAGAMIDTIGGLAKLTGIDRYGKVMFTEYPYFLCQANIMNLTHAEVYLSIVYLDDSEERSKWENRIFPCPLRDSDKLRLVGWVIDCIPRLKSNVIKRKPKGRKKLGPGPLMLEA